MHKNWVQVNLFVILFCIPILSEGKSLLDWPNQDYRDNAYGNHYWNSEPGFGVSYSSAKANQDDRPFSPTANKQAIYVPPIGYSKEEMSNILQQYYGLKESIIPKHETKPQNYDSYDSHQMWENPSQLSGNENSEDLQYKNPPTLTTLYKSTYTQTFENPKQYNDYKLVKGAQDELRSYTQNVKGNGYGKDSGNYDKPKAVSKMNFDKTESVTKSGLNDLYAEKLKLYDQNILKDIHSTKLKKYDLESANKMTTKIVTEAVDDNYDEPNIFQDLKNEQYKYDYAVPVLRKDLGLKQEQNREALHNYDTVKRVHSIKLKKSAMENGNKMKTKIVTEAVDDDYDKPNVLQDLKSGQYGYDDYDAPVVHKDLSQKQEQNSEVLYDIVKPVHSIKLKKSALENRNKVKTEIVTEAVDDDYDKSNVLQDLKREQYGYDDYDAPVVHKDLSLKREDYPETQYNHDIVKRVHSIKLKKSALENRNKTEIVTEAIDDDYDKPNILQDLKNEQYGYDYAAPVVHKDLSQKQEQNREALYNYDIVKRVHSIKLKKSALKNGNRLKTEIVTEAVDDDYDKPDILQDLKKLQHGYDYDAPVVHKDLSQKQNREDNHEFKTMAKNANKNLDTKTATMKPNVKNKILKRVKRWRKGSTIKPYVKTELSKKYYKLFLTENPNIVHIGDSIFSENESNKYEIPNNYEMSKHYIPVVTNKKLKSSNKCSMRKRAYNADCSKIENFDKLYNSENYDLKMKVRL